MTVPEETLRLLDDLIRRDLQSARDWFFFWLLVSTALVIIGVALEGPELLKELCEEFHKLRTRKLILNAATGLPICSPEKVSGIKIVGLIGWILVTLGVAGEGIFEGLVSKADGSLQTFNDILLADARDRAARAESTAKSFDAQILEARRGTAEAQRDAGIAKKAASEADERAEHEKLEREKLDLLVSPRRISQDDQRRIRDALAKFGRHTIRISSNGLDAEAAVLGAQIIASLPTSFTVRDERAQSISTGSFDFGIHVRGPQTEQDLVMAIRDALRSIGKLQTWANTGLPRTGAVMGGAATMSGPVTMSGGGGPPGTPGVTAPGTSVWIEIGVKPVQTDNGLR
jgi:hypothetical protein